MKKIFSLGIILATILSLVSPKGATAQTTATVSVSPRLTSVTVGSPVTVDVRIAGGVNVAAYQFRLNYNPSVFQVASTANVVNGSFLGTAAGRTITFNTPTIDTTTNPATVLVSAYSTGTLNTGANGSGILASVTFNTLAGATSSPLTLSSVQVVMADLDANLQPSTNVNSSVTVSSPVTSTPVPPSPTRTPTPIAPSPTRTPTPIAPSPTRTPTAIPPSPTRTPTPGVGSPTPTPAGIFFEAEQGTLTSPFTAANGNISQAIETTDPTQGGKATYSFTISQAGNYLVTMKVNAPLIAYNSLFVNIDSEPTSPTMIWDIYPVTSGFENRTVSWRGTGTDAANEIVPKPFNLTTGSHTLIVRGREANVQIDSILITMQASCRKLQGDANCDGLVDGVDYSRWLNSQCVPGTGQTCANYDADFDGNGRVDDNDLATWTANRQ